MSFHSSSRSWLTESISCPEFLTLFPLTCPNYSSLYLENCYWNHRTEVNGYNVWVLCKKTQFSNTYVEIVRHFDEVGLKHACPVRVLEVLLIAGAFIARSRDVNSERDDGVMKHLITKPNKRSRNVTRCLAIHKS